MDYIRWSLPYAELLRFRHAELWLEGARCRRRFRKKSAGGLKERMAKAARGNG